MQHASLEESSAMLLLKMLQPDEGIMALGKILWGLAKASGVNRLVLLCVVLNGRYIAQCWYFISIMVTKVPSYPKGVFCVATLTTTIVLFTWQHLVSVSLWGCYMQNSGKIKKKHFNTKIANMLIFIFNTLN